VRQGNYYYYYYYYYQYYYNPLLVQLKGRKGWKCCCCSRHLCYHFHHDVMVTPGRGKMMITAKGKRVYMGQ